MLMGGTGVLMYSRTMINHITLHAGNFLKADLGAAATFLKRNMWDNEYVNVLEFSHHFSLHIIWKNAMHFEDLILKGLLI